MKIRKGDTVKVLYGKDAGKTGKVLRVVNKDNKIVVDGVNMFKKHVKGDGQSRSSEIITISKPLDVAKVMLIDPSDNKPTRVKYEISSGGEKERVSVRTGKKIDKSVKVDDEKMEKKSPKNEKVKKPSDKVKDASSKSTKKK